ncbi:glycosyltransferase [Thermodesulfobacteriota bacterium]
MSNHYLREINNRKDKEKWLIIAHCFNMDGRAASHTITDRMPYFLDEGVVPIVLSAPTGDRDNRFPHFQIFSAAPSGVLFEFRHIIKKRFPNPFLEKSIKAILVLICLPFYVLEKIFFHLDSQWSWLISASIRGFFLIKKYRPKIIYSTAGPPSTHAAAFILNKIFKIPWLAELHDPLIYDSDSGKSQRYRFNRWIERSVFKNADAVIYFTDKALYRAKRRNPKRDNLHVIRPGAPPLDIPEVRYKKLDKIHFGHFGSLGDGRDLSLFIRALYEIIMERPQWRDMISLDIYGAPLDSVSMKALSQYPINGILCEYGRLEYDPSTDKSGRRRVLEAMRKCDVLFIIHGTDPICEEYIPSKIYEYFFTYRPILGLAKPESELRDLLEYNGHIFVDSGDLNEIKSVVKDLITRWETKGLPDQKTKSSFTTKDAVSSFLQITSRIL